MKIAVFCPNLIGDTVMATPAFRALRRGFSDARLTAIIKPRVWPTLEGTSWFDELIRFDSASDVPKLPSYPPWDLPLRSSRREFSATRLHEFHCSG